MFPSTKYFLGRPLFFLIELDPKEAFTLESKLDITLMLLKEGEIMTALWVGTELEPKVMLPSGKYFLGRPLFFLIELEPKEAFTLESKLDITLLDGGILALVGSTMVFETEFVNGLGPTNAIFFSWRWCVWGCGGCGSRGSMNIKYSEEKGDWKKLWVNVYIYSH